MRLCWALLLASLSLAAEGPRLSFSKSFPGSSPAYVLITVDKSGEASYQEAPDEPNPTRFTLAPAEAAELFALADKLERFQRPLESPLKVANMGMKTLRFQDGTAAHEVKFNFSQDLDARTLVDWFERIMETQQHLAALERTARFDKLGVNKHLLLLQASFDRNRVVAPDQFLRWLDRIAKNESYLHMARERAAAMADAIRSGKPKAE